MKKEPPSVAVILAAGKGTRMRSSKPKVLHEVCGKAMLSWCIEAAKTVCDDVLVVLGHKREDVRAHLPEGTLEAVQDPPKGTGDALRVASQNLPSEGVVIVLPSDAPLIQAATLQRLLESHQEALCTVLTAHIKPQESANKPPPIGYPIGWSNVGNIHGFNTIWRLPGGAIEMRHPGVSQK